MMGANHAATGAAAWFAVAGSGPLMLGWYPVHSSGLLIGAAVCAGAAMLPDADHHAGTISHSLPPLSRLVTRGVAHVSGGHRHGTHSLLGILVFAALGALLGAVRVPSPVGTLAVGAGVISLLLVAYAAKALRMTSDATWLRSWLLATGVAAAITVFAPEDPTWLAVCVGLGAAVHVLGDALTTGGVPLLWPWTPDPPRWWAENRVLRRVWQRNGWGGVPVLGRTGSVREWLLAVPVSLYATYGLVVAFVGMLESASRWLPARVLAQLTG
ncbi:metal-dependent hydrolase [Cellulomonas sp. 179-A 4D5 NHS]|uniref:metal-dependent hydrolase n=1 Tax=Cellulomonas sp. 179-A 4D5 NHS TaxID=3142378 RepID=UPI0039A31802